ncbi:tyrosine/serine/threonine protein phosphatase pps1 [Lecanora helva]
MSKASEIATNVWLGPTPDSIVCPPSDDDPVFDILIDTNDLAQPPEPRSLKRIAESSCSTPQRLEFPSSGSIVPEPRAKTASDPLRMMCQWIHRLANPRSTPDSSESEEDDSDGDIPMKNLGLRPRKILIHCTDGYTESTLLALAYYMYAEQIPAHEAWLRLHCEKQRNFFAYPSDVTLLSSLQPCLLPKSALGLKERLAQSEEPAWLARLDGSLPSRILPYMYLGNLGHANNLELLRKLGIGRILSVGEPATWTKSQVQDWGTKNFLYVDHVQDNGVDPLTKEFDRCLDFIGKGKADGSATLVHCRVGVSRSATICIAEVMSSLGLSFPRAYCYVRARRLNVIIQPHLRFAYELLKWDETCQQKRGEAIRRELEWATVAREIAAMNKPYASR